MRKLHVRKRGSAVERTASDWVRKQFNSTPGGFRLSPHTPVCLIGSSCAALSCEVLGNLSQWSSSQVETWASYLQGFQQENGWFEDPYLNPQEGNSLDSAYLRGHATFLAMMGLDALGYRPQHPLEFLDAWRDDDKVYDWIDQRDWTNPWRESNWVEWLGYWLLVDAGLSVTDVPLEEKRFPAGFAGLMSWLENHQDRTTGFWGNPPYGGMQRTLHQMAAAYHHYIFYYATGREIPCLDRIVDHTLSLQQRDGLFAPGRLGGGPCEDLDAVDILANMHRLADYRRRDIEVILNRALLGLLANQRRSGAFVYAQNDKSAKLFSTLETIFRPSYPPGIWTRRQAWQHYFSSDDIGPQQRYAGCPRLSFHVGEGDMFSQWFRPLAIAIAATVLGQKKSPVWWEFRFRKQITQGWWPGRITSTNFAEERAVG